jgi:lipoate-protein ligase B
VNTVSLHRWPITEYAVALHWQESTAESVRGGGAEALALLQHGPVYTLGRRVKREYLLADEAMLRARGAEVVETDRGGDITFHGPGQAVGYPILRLDQRGLSPIDYVRALEETLIRTLALFGIDAVRSPGRPGVWVGEAKIASIGVRIRRGVSTHGFALNVDTDLSWFDTIVPCGIVGARMTSMSVLLGAAPSVEAVGDTIAHEFESVFGLTLTRTESRGCSTLSA